VKWWQWLLAAIGLGLSLALTVWGDMRAYGGTPVPEEVDCKVARFLTASGTGTAMAPVCAIECAWSQGKRGFASSTPVRCSEWSAGERVHRSRDPALLSF
jgi:hypothetical protein